MDLATVNLMILTTKPATATSITKFEAGRVNRMSVPLETLEGKASTWPFGNQEQLF